MSCPNIFQSSSSEKRWVNQINTTLSKHTTIEIPTPPVCIFHVPQTLTISKPQAYVPQHVGIGPYHHLRPELHKMQRHKLDVVKRVLTRDQILDFQHLVVDKLKDFESTIRSCYDVYLDLDGNTLAWIVAIDGLFLLDRLGCDRSSTFDLNSNSQDNVANGIQSVTDDQTPSDTILCDIQEIRNATEDIEPMKGQTPWGNIVKIRMDMAIEVDQISQEMMMLENQIPLILLKEIQKSLHLSSKTSSLDMMLAAFCEALSPLDLMPGVFFQNNCSPTHLLDCMYHLIVGNIEPKSEPELKSSYVAEEVFADIREESETLLSNVVQVLGILGASRINIPFMVLKSLPWHKITALYKSLGGKTGEEGNIIHSVEEITIPSVSELQDVGGITFRLTPGGIRDIKFDADELVFYLPLLTLTSTSEVILRNLVAYEASVIAPRSTLELTEYVDLMCGIVDTVKDSKLLREKGIINGDLNDGEISRLFNGMHKYSFHPVKSSSNLRVAIRKVNEHFDSRPRVKVTRFMKKQLKFWGKILLLFSTIFVVLLIVFEQVCLVYGCNTHIFGENGLHSVISKL